MAEEITHAPPAYRYTKEHEWASLDGDTATIGITDYAAHELGDVVYVQLPDPGATVSQFQKFGEIESVKAVSDLFSPVTGEVVEANGALLEHPELVNEVPFEAGWLLKVRVQDPEQTANLLDAGAYQEYLLGLSG